MACALLRDSSVAYSREDASSPRLEWHHAALPTSKKSDFSESRLADDIVPNGSVHVGKPHMAPSVQESEVFVVQAHQVEGGRP